MFECEFRIVHAVVGHAAMNSTCGVSVDPTAAAVPHVFETPRYSAKIMGGRKSEKFRWPWQVAVLNGYKV